MRDLNVRFVHFNSSLKHTGITPLERWLDHCGMDRRRYGVPELASSSKNNFLTFW
jgi:hypothetical protein